MHQPLHSLYEQLPAIVKRYEADLSGAHAYVCGPPPMVEAAMTLLAALGVEDKRIYYDKFTTTGETESS